MRGLTRLIRHDWPLHFVLLLTNWLPDNVVFLRLRGALARPFLGHCGPNLRLGRNVTFYNPSQIDLGKDIYIAYGCWFMAGEKISVGDEVLFGPYCVVASSNHSRKGWSFRYGPAIKKPIEIAGGSWLAAHVTVTAGASIGKGCLIAANSVVTGKIDEYQLAGGAPARPCKVLE
jgi:acetyltransferase-like isoleucine patch superfamily enzyme